MLCIKKLHSTHTYIESVTKCNQLKDHFIGAGKVIPKLHANHSHSIEKYLVSPFRYFFAQITSSVIRQSNDKIGIYFECLGLIVNVPIVYDQSVRGSFLSQFTNPLQLYALKKSWQSLSPALCRHSDGLVVGCGIGPDVAFAMILQGSNSL